MLNKYICSACGVEFTKGWSDEEAQSEAFEVFPDVPSAAMELVCDPCYRKIMEFAAETGR